MTTGLHAVIGHPDAGDIMAKVGPLPSRTYGLGDILLPVLRHLSRAVLHIALGWDHF